MADLQYRIKKTSGKLNTSVSLSGSKSISNRLLIMNELGKGAAQFENLSVSEDTRRLQKAMKMITVCAGSRIPLVIDAGNAGTVMRFLSGFLSVREGRWLLTGSDRMKERPIKELVETLTGLGAQINFTGQFGYPPLLISGNTLTGKAVVMDANISSQFISSLMMIAPEMSGGLSIIFKEKPVSFPYIRMTAELMRRFGVEVDLSDDKVVIPETSYKMTDQTVEPDWSSASYWYETVALQDEAEVRLPYLRENSLQGDSVVAEIFRDLGVHTEFDNSGVRLSRKGAAKHRLAIHFENCPDLVPAVMTTCAALGTELKLTGIHHLKYKESDRIDALKTELSKLGARFSKDKSVLTMIPGKFDKKYKFSFDTYLDHRMAMCFAPLALRCGEVVINDPLVTIKSYPNFWYDLQQSGCVAVDKI